MPSESPGLDHLGTQELVPASARAQPREVTEKLTLGHCRRF